MFKKIVIIFCVFFLIGCSEEIAPEKPLEIENTNKANNQLQVEGGPEEFTEKENVDAGKTITIPKEQVEQSRNEILQDFYNMNEDIHVDYLKYNVIKVETFTKMGTSFMEKETIGKFLKVHLEITNEAKETQQIFTPRFRIIDDQDRKFDRLSDDFFYIADGIEFGKQLQPSLSISGAVVFELPKDSQNLKLEIVGDWISVSKVLVSLSNIKNIQIDTTLKNKQDKMMDDAMEEAESQVDEMMGKCNAPFICTSSCGQYMDVGKKDCPSGELCCME